jgi:hypothetical protein
VVARPDAVARDARRVVEPLRVAGRAVGGGQRCAAGGGRHRGGVGIQAGDRLFRREIPVAQEGPGGVADEVAAREDVVVDQHAHQAQLAVEELVGQQQRGARLHAAAQAAMFAGELQRHRALAEVQRLAGDDVHRAADAAFGHVGGDALDHIDGLDHLGRQLAQIGAAPGAAAAVQHRHAVDLDAVQVGLHAADGHLRAFAEIARQLHARHARQGLADVLVGELVDVFRDQAVLHRGRILLAVVGALDGAADAGDGDGVELLRLGLGGGLGRRGGLLGLGRAGQGGGDGQGQRRPMQGRRFDVNLLQHFVCLREYRPGGLVTALFIAPKTV